jgi:hypothetical protein
MEDLIPVKINDVNVYMAEHLRSTMYFRQLSYAQFLNRRLAGTIES